MKYIPLVVISPLCIVAVSGYALERTVALPYQYGAAQAQNVFVPNCTSQQVVGVSGSIFVCKDVPTCGESGKYLTFVDGSFFCTNGGTITSCNASVSTPYPAKLTPTKVGDTYTITSSSGMTITNSSTCEGKNILSPVANGKTTASCPAGYTLSQSGPSEPKAAYTGQEQESVCIAHSCGDLYSCKSWEQQTCTTYGYKYVTRNYPATPASASYTCQKWTM